MREKLFPFALLGSLAVHFLVFGGLFVSPARYPKKVYKKMQVVYHPADIVKKEKREVRPNVVRNVSQQKTTVATKALIPQQSLPSELFKEMDRPPAHLAQHDKQPLHVPSLEGKRHITVPVLKSEKITNPKYLAYKEKIRSKIQDQAYFYFNGSSVESGDVQLAFIIDSQGVLKQVKVLGGSAAGSENLHQIGIMSIKEASPFPPLPEGQYYPELPFEIVISFKAER